LSLSDLASKTGLNRSTIWKFENSPHPNPTLDNLLGIQQALGLASIEQLLGGFLRFPSEALAHEGRPE
jgi:transcriptional regulator with XRE-family HTH domain